MTLKGMPSTVTANGEVFLTFAEVSRRTGTSGDVIRNWVKKKKLATCMVLGRQMVAEKALEEFLQPKPLAPGVLLPGLGRKGC